MLRQVKLEKAQQSETPENRAVVPLIPPTLKEVKLDNIQGDVYPTFAKKYEGFLFFTIKDANAFRTSLRGFRSSITTSEDAIEILKQIQKARRTNIENQSKDLANIDNQFNIGFSRAAFEVLDIRGGVGDDAFNESMLKGAKDLGDIPALNSMDRNCFIPDWDQHWLDINNPIHGVIVVASQDDEKYTAAIKKVQDSFTTSIKINFELKGKVRDDLLKGHEFFGFLDGISQPAIKGLVKPHEGQPECNAGVIIHGTPGDNVDRPAWGVGGTIMAFRQLQQFVFKFEQFLKDHPMNPPDVVNKEPDEGAHRRGAKMFGRWKSGCPIDRSPDHDDPTIGGDVEKNNDFTYDEGRDVRRCPITAHIRKMVPRANPRIPPEVLEGHLIMRGSIPYGEEIKPEERRGEVPEQERGLLFASYQSALAKGFKFVQEDWANATGFPIGYSPNPGFDPIIGAAEGDNRFRFTRGEDSNNLSAQLPMPRDFIKARGGEYFWVPGMVGIDSIASNKPMEFKPKKK